MQIDFENFTPFRSLLGGMMIGAAAGVLILCCGRIAGISGITGGLLKNGISDRAWRVAFLTGMLLSPAIYRICAPLPVIHTETSWGWLIIAGLYVGLGSRYGAGCTSGHGVCGLARFSGRSVVATLTFMAAAMLTVWLMRL